jgi:hypothetical protein
MNGERANIGKASTLRELEAEIGFARPSRGFFQELRNRESRTLRVGQARGRRIAAGK